jgi:hypothetical protein
MSVELAGPAMTGFWSTLEIVHGGSAFPTTLLEHLGTSYAAFRTLFLTERPGETADSVPCPWKCGCYHKLVPQDNGTTNGICQCDPPTCGTYTVLPYEPIPQYLDWSKLGKAVCKPLGLVPKNVKLGLFNTMQIGTWQSPCDEDAASDSIPAILTLPASRAELLNTISGLAAKLGQPFILFAPLSRHLSPAAKELLDSLGAAFFSLDALLKLHPEPPPPNVDPFIDPNYDPHAIPVLIAKIPLENLFADIAPLLPSPSEDDLARRTFLALQDSESNDRARKPTLYTVFKRYCVEEMTARETARKCKCSLGTISKRLVELRRKTGVSPARLRGISSQFVQLENDFAEARANHHRRNRSHDS